MLTAFERTKALANVDLEGGLGFFTEFKAKVAPHIDFKRGHLLRAVDKKLRKMRTHAGSFKKCTGVKCVIVGAGPVGLRAAIEFALLEANVTVIERRTDFTRCVSWRHRAAKCGGCAPQGLSVSPGVLAAVFGSSRPEGDTL